MKVVLESTTKLVELNGVPARLWSGTTDSGLEVHAFVTRICTPRDCDQAQFQAELRECAAPRPEIEAIPLRLVL